MNNGDRISLFDGLTLDLARGCVTRSGEPLHLRPQTYEVLKYLVENRGRLISKDKLIQEVWKGRAVTDSSLVKCIEDLRDALGPEARQFIRTVHGRGYIFDTGSEDRDNAKPTTAQSEQIDFVRVTVEEDETNGELITPLNQARAIAIPRSRIQPGTAALIVAAIVVIGASIAFGVYWLISQRQSRNTSLAVPFHEMKISRLTTSGKTTHAAISSDGEYIAHVTVDAEGDSLWVRHVAAPTSVRIAGPAATEYVWVAFARDGDSVYYLTLDRDKGDTVLYRVPVLGGASSETAKDVGPIGFSPDGKQITYVRNWGDGNGLVVAEPDGKNERLLVQRRQPEFFQGNWNAPGWSPDGKIIACPVRLSDEHGQYETVLGVSVEDRSARPLTSARWNYAGQPVWLADASGLLVTAEESAAAPVQVWHIALKTGSATRITNDLNNYSDLTMTADSSKLAAVQVDAVSNIWVAPEADASRARQIGSEVGWIQEAAWTPDGRIVYRSNAGGSADIWVMNADGSNPKQLTTGARASRGLAVSPDGRYIFFASYRTGRFNLWRVDADGGNLKQMTDGFDEMYPHCTPDGQWVVYQRAEKEPRLWKVPAEGGKPVQLSETRAVRPAVSPDGALVAYHYLDSDVEKSRWSIGIVSYAGGPRLKRFDFPLTARREYRFVRWAPDRQSITYANSPGGSADIWAQPLDGGPPRQLTNFKAERIVAFDWAPDGRTLVFVRNVETSDVVMIEQNRR